MAIIITLLILSVLMFVHEFGHFILARMNGVFVEEFSLGMGPKLWQTKRKDTLYTLRLLPIGAYVKMLGEEEVDESEGSLLSKGIWQRISVFFAGPFMNFLLALAIFAGVYMFVGTPSTSNVIGDILPESAAVEMGLQTGDRIIEINGNPIRNWNDISQTVQNAGDETLQITVLRNAEEIQLVGHAKYSEQEQRYLIGFLQSWDKFNVIDSMKFGLTQTYNFTKNILVALVQMVTGKIPVDVSGPVGIVGAVDTVASYGFANILLFAAMLSINLGIINLLPFPALDGSRIVFALAELVRGKPLAREKENMVHFIGLMILFGLMIIITYKDILRLFS